MSWPWGQKKNNRNNYNMHIGVKSGCTWTSIDWLLHRLDIMRH